MITHPDKVLFPDAGITKGELAAYYETVAPLMLPFISGRPLTMERYPSGVNAKGFFHKSVSRGFPEWLRRVDVPKKGGVVHYPIVTDERSLMWVVNQNCITFHVWTSRLPDLMRPDLCVFDLDPASEDDYEPLRAGALALRDLLTELGLRTWLKTTGSKGFHIVVPLDGDARMGAVARFAHRVGAILVARDPDRLTQEFSKVDRGGRILVDTGRNGHGATFAAPYSVRPKAEAPVSAPCTWDELEAGRVHPRTFTLRNMADRLRDTGDVWAGMSDMRQPLEPALERLAELR